MVGENLYGVVDRVPGSFYVATLFFYLGAVPLVPARSYLVIEGSERDPTIFEPGSFNGWPIPRNGKSLLFLYVRLFLTLPIAICVGIAVFALMSYLVVEANSKYLLMAVPSIVGAGVFGGLAYATIPLSKPTLIRLENLAFAWKDESPKAAAYLRRYLQSMSPPAKFTPVADETAITPSDRIS